MTFIVHALLFWFRAVQSTGLAGLPEGPVLAHVRVCVFHHDTMETPTRRETDGILLALGMSHATTASPKPPLRARWREDDTVVGRGK